MMCCVGPGAVVIVVIVVAVVLMCVLVQDTAMGVFARILEYARINELH